MGILPSLQNLTGLGLRVREDWSPLRNARLGLKAREDLSQPRNARLAPSRGAHLPISRDSLASLRLAAGTGPPDALDWSSWSTLVVSNGSCERHRTPPPDPGPWSSPPTAALRRPDFLRGIYTAQASHSESDARLPVTSTAPLWLGVGCWSHARLLSTLPCRGAEYL